MLEKTIQDERLLSYCAGIFDGEGCFTIYKYHAPKSARYPYYSAYAVINIREKAICEIFKRRFGGRVASNKRANNSHSETFIWKVSAKNIRHFISEIKPYLILKRKQADLIESLFSIRKIGSKTRITESEYLEMERHKMEMHKLNMRGVGKPDDVIIPSMYRKLIPGENYTGEIE